jgi:hypothetical protein
MFESLKGKRTYIVVGVAITWALVGAILGYLQPQEAFNIVLTALGGAGLRAAK